MVNTTAHQLLSLTGDDWKDVRTTFSPIFTSGKMKAMMVFIQETSKSLTEEIIKLSISGNEIELKDVFGMFSMDTLASCAFGVDAQSFSSSGIFDMVSFFNLIFFLQWY